MEVNTFLTLITVLYISELATSIYSYRYKYTVEHVRLVFLLFNFIKSISSLPVADPVVTHGHGYPRAVAIEGPLASRLGLGSGQLASPLARPGLGAH